MGLPDPHSAGRSSPESVGFASPCHSTSKSKGRTDMSESAVVERAEEFRLGFVYGVSGCLTCVACGQAVCAVDGGMTLAELIRAMAHDCGASQPRDSSSESPGQSVARATNSPDSARPLFHPDQPQDAET